jgi:DNA processing protein
VNLIKLENKIKCDYLTITNNNYPVHLKRIYKPPFVIFGVGEFSNLDQPLITIVGRVEKFNIEFLDALNDFGYGFVYQVNENTYKSAKKMTDLGYRTVFVVEQGITSDYKGLYGTNTLVISETYTKPKEEYDDQKLNRITLGSENKVLFIDYDECEQYQNDLALCHRERNHLYKIIYKYDQSIVSV